MLVINSKRSSDMPPFPFSKSLSDRMDTPVMMENSSWVTSSSLRRALIVAVIPASSSAMFVTISLTCNMLHILAKLLQLHEINKYFLQNIAEKCRFSLYFVGYFIKTPQMCNILHITKTAGQLPSPNHATPSNPKPNTQFRDPKPKP